MGHTGGSFWGYREKFVIQAKKSRIRQPAATLGIPKLDPVQIDALVTPTFGNKVFGRKYADDDFPDDFVFFGFTSRHIVLWLKHASVDIIYTFDGETPQETRVITESYRAVEAMQGYKIRNHVPGVRAWYQLIAFW